MSQTWSIKIVPAGDGVRFDPDVFGIEPGQPLKAQAGDLVSWNNETSASQVVSVYQAGTQVKSFETKPIASFMSSSPGYVIQTTDVDTKNPPDGAVGTVRYGTATADGTITVVNS
jgi:hypothetical protein